jgi:hypothetical protein
MARIVWISTDMSNCQSLRFPSEAEGLTGCTATAIKRFNPVIHCIASIPVRRCMATHGSFEPSLHEQSLIAVTCG